MTGGLFGYLFHAPKTLIFKITCHTKSLYWRSVKLPAFCFRLIDLLGDRSFNYVYLYGCTPDRNRTL